MVRLLLRLGPYALLAAVAAGLAASWDRLPVSGPLLTGLVAVTWIGILRRFTLANSSPVPDPARSRRLTVAITIGLQWFLALLFGLAAVPRQGPGLAVAGAGLGMLFLPIALIATYAGKAPPAPQAEPPPPPGGWLLVPRKNGTGLRIAPGHPRTWQAVVLFAAGLVAIIAVALVR